MNEADREALRGLAAYARETYLCFKKQGFSAKQSLELVEFVIMIGVSGQSVSDPMTEMFKNMAQ